MPDDGSAAADTGGAHIDDVTANGRDIRLWAGWRHRYLNELDASDGGTPVASSASARRSLFVDILESGRPDHETLIVHRGASVFVILNLHPYSVGHQMVIPYRAVPRLSDLTVAEHDELWRTATQAVDVVTSEYSPQGVNVGLGRAAGGSVPGHLHVHVVPRWLGEGNFLAATALTRTLPEPLDVTAERLRERWRTRTTA